MLIDRRLFRELGGFDPAFGLEFGDVDLPLRAAMAGWRTVWTPEATLVHHEGITRWADLGDGGDWERFRARWEPVLEGCDAFLHPGYDFERDYEPATGRLPHRSSREPPWSRARADGAIANRPSPTLGARAAMRGRMVRVAREEARDMTDRHGTARAALELALQSRSWRLTRPLRRVAAFLRRN